MNPLRRTATPALLALAILPAPDARAAQAPLLVVSGFVQGSYAASSRAVEGRIAGNLYASRHDVFELDAAMLKFERVAPSDRPGSGFVVEAMAGDHASFVRAAGLDLGEHADVVQAYGTLSFPSAGLAFSAGKMATMLGNEVIETVANPNLSVGGQCVFLENFTDTGVDAAWTGANGWSARVRVANGWDVVADNNEEKTVFGRIGWSGDGRSVAFLGYTGSELPDSVGGQRSGAELLAGLTVRGVGLTLQLDMGREEALDAEWRAAGLWVRVPLREAVELALRADLLDDADGARTSGALGLPAHDGQQLMSLTGTLNVRTVPGALLRPEVRWDRSDLPAFDGHQEQWTVALGAAFTF